ncbi:FAD/NAD(P)-binding domain-containing protein [Pholiota conissans]|uniref:FAD/NAD(P)-binding domain-containing protein n=1 Tax=Pholiota conissans TaxID=109636 RepID=A0A9P6CMB6_9AGAR|nr:FAD/NAD(P)-binding domain-containing protein [Pholiota conissans]
MRVAVVGSGVSGLGATWLLNEHSDHEVHLYESDSRPGGHANTVHFVPHGKTEGVDVDTGFIVCNPDTYPNFLRFLQLYAPSKAPGSWLPSLFDSSDEKCKDQEIRVVPTEMTFSISRDGGAFEWAGKNLATVFCQPRRLVDPQMWRMIYDVLRFNVCARRVIMKPPQPGETEISIGEYLKREGYSTAFRKNYLIPMTAAIWSTPPDDCSLDFPARTLIQFMYNHNLLQVTGKPSWLTIQGGSHNYVKKILSELPSENLHLSTGIKSVKSLPSTNDQKPQVLLVTEHGEEQVYDHVILACHSDASLEILRAGNITEDEERILGQFDWNHNEAILHSDVSLMPKSRLAWSCWNYLSFTKSVPPPSNQHRNGYSTDQESDDLYAEKSGTVEREVNEVSLTYGMNDLQHISESKYGPVLVTLNPPFEPACEKIGGRWKYDHPVLDTKAVRAQNEMHKIQNTRSISYAGAYLKYGFHEDGFTSGLLAACSVDSAQSGLPSATAYTASLKGMTIPTLKSSVRPPFEIEHADHHVRLSRRGSENVGYEMLAFGFDFFEKSGTRELVGHFGCVLLFVVGWLLGIQNL